MNQEEGGRLFREAWITGVKKHYPDTPKPSYILPWEQMAQWEQEAAQTAYEQIRAFMLAGDQDTYLTRQQKSRLVATCWNWLVYKYLHTPKESYVVSWEQLPQWQQEVDADIYETIADAVRHDLTNSV